MNISFEIVPRSLTAFDEQYAFVETLNGVTMLNVPDIQRFDTRSWQVAQRIDRSKYLFVPHFRAIDFKSDGLELSRIIDEFQLDSILLVSGDPPEGLKRAYYQTNVVDLIRVIANRHPQLKLYAGFDPHRAGVQEEYQYIQRKIDAGVQGFFSQPFYDLRMVEIYAELLSGTESYIGLSPITSNASMNYWQVKNKVQFPVQFRSDLDWHVDFAHQVMQFTQRNALNVYFMPIKVDLKQYFGRLQLSA